MTSAASRDMIETLRVRMEMRKRIIDEIERIRVAQRVTQATICTRTGINNKTYCMIKNGNGEKVTIDSLILIMLRLGLHVSIDVCGDKFYIGERAAE